MSQTDRIFNRSFILMLCTGFLLFMSITMVSPIMASYALSLNVAGGLVGFLAGLFSISSLIIRPICGKAVDLKSKKKILMGSYFVVFLAMLGYAFSNSIPMLFCFRILHGLGWGFASTTSMTVAIDSLPHKRMAAGIGFYTMMQTTATAIAPMVGLSIASQYGFQTTYLTGAMMALLGLMMTPFVMTTPPKNAHLSLFKSLKIRELLEKNAILPALLTCCNAMTGAAIGTFLALYAIKLGVTGIGIYFSVNAVTMLVTRPFLGYLTERFGLMKVIIPCEILMAISVIGLALSTNLTGILVVAVLMGIGSSGASPALVAACINSTSVDKRGVATSTNYVGLDSGLFLGASIAGLLINWIGYTGAFSFFALPILISLALYVVSERNKPEVHQPLDESELILKSSTEVL